MAYKVRVEAPCVECGEMTNRRLKNGNLPCCLECAKERMEAANRMMNAHRGRVHDAWVAGMLRSLSRAARTPTP